MTRRQAAIDIALMSGLTAVATVALTPFASFLLNRYGLISVVVVQGLIILLVLRVLLWFRRQRWLDLGLRSLKMIDLRRAIYAFLACIASNALLIALAMMVDKDFLSEHLRRLMEVTDSLVESVPMAGLAPILLFVGVYEELAARGFLLNRFRTALVSTWAAILLSSIMFGLAHAYQGWFGVIQTTLIGMVLAYLTVRWETLWPAILAHASLNLMSLSTMEAISEKLG